MRKEVSYESNASKSLWALDEILSMYEREIYDGQYPESVSEKTKDLKKCLYEHLYKGEPKGYDVGTQVHLTSIEYKKVSK